MSQACSGESWSITEPEPTRGPSTHADTGMSFHVTDGQEVVRNPRPVNGEPLGVSQGSCALGQELAEVVGLSGPE